MKVIYLRYVSTILIISIFTCSGLAQPAQDNETVWIYKYDESKQCAVNSGLELKAMQKELKKIKVLSAKKQPDDKMRTAVCGAPTGIMNSYEIPKKDLNKAIKLGFKVLSQH